ncbi:hypothetical protein RB213_005591 [Colletotrichum asianum]
MRPTDVREVSFLGLVGDPGPHDYRPAHTMDSFRRRWGLVGSVLVLAMRTRRERVVRLRWWSDEQWHFLSETGKVNRRDSGPVCVWASSCW